VSREVESGDIGDGVLNGHKKRQEAEKKLRERKRLGNCCPWARRGGRGARGR
jgi:hypothetical protein